MKNAEYWLWLQNAVGAGRPASQIVDFFGDAETLYKSGKREWYISGLLSKRLMNALSESSPEKFVPVIEKSIKNGWKIITLDDDLYPERLKDIYAPPLVLFVDGSTDALNYPLSVSIVGTRNISDYGFQAADSISYCLAKSGCEIVSGGALGVDSASHLAAMRAGGITVAFLGCGFGVNYLMQNEKMRREIAESGGALVSEYLPGTQASRYTFPIRNRLISGLSLGTVVIEAGLKSGSLITAGEALEQGKDVFAVPGMINDIKFAGTNNLIRDGVKPVFSFEDILDEYKSDYPEYYIPGAEYDNRKKSSNTFTSAERKRTAKTKKAVKKEVPADKKTFAADKTDVKKEKEKSAVPEFLSEKSKSVLSVLSCEPIGTDKISEKSGLPIKDVLQSLTELEIFGLAKSEAGQRYSKF